MMSASVVGMENTLKNVGIVTARGKELGKDAARYAAEAIAERAKALAESSRDTGDNIEKIVVVETSYGANAEAQSDHAAYIEFGTAPHFPPVEALRDWSSRHGIDEPFLVARAISQKGTTAKPFMKPAEGAAATGLAKVESFEPI